MELKSWNEHKEPDRIPPAILNPLVTILSGHIYDLFQACIGQSELLLNLQTTEVAAV